MANSWLKFKLTLNESMLTQGFYTLVQGAGDIEGSVNPVPLDELHSMDYFTNYDYDDVLYDFITAGL